MSARDTDKILNGPLKSASAPPIKGKLSTQILIVLALLGFWAVGGYLIWGVANEGRKAAREGTAERPLLRADINKLIAGRVENARKIAQLASRRAKENRGRVVKLTRIIEGSPGAPGAIGLGERGQPGVGFAGPIGPIGFGTPGMDGADGVDGTTGANGAPGADGVQGPQGATGPEGPIGPTGPTGSEPDLSGRTLTCEPTADPLDPPARQTCTFDP